MTIKYEEFVEKYKPQKNHIVKGEAPYGDCMYETYGEEVQYICDIINNEGKEKHVWTILDGDYEETWVVPGYFLVNRIGYLVTEVPWESEDIEVNDNEMLTLEESYQACLDFFKNYGYNLGNYEISMFFLSQLTWDTSDISIGKAKYLAIEYWESLNNELTDDMENTIHDYYSQLK